MKQLTSNGCIPDGLPSKTQRKKEARHLQKLGEELLKLSAAQIKDIKLPAEIYDAVLFARTIKSHGALRRQMQYIGTLMRKIDPAPVQEALQQIQDGNCLKARAFKDLEKLRDDLIEGRAGGLEELMEKYPRADRQYLTRLVRQAVEERGHNIPPKSARSLFRYLRKLQSDL